jgi:hypothetical protein
VKLWLQLLQAVAPIFHATRLLSSDSPAECWNSNLAIFELSWSKSLYLEVSCYKYVNAVVLIFMISLRSILQRSRPWKCVEVCCKSRMNVMLRLWVELPLHPAHLTLDQMLNADLWNSRPKRFRFLMTGC